MSAIISGKSAPIFSPKELEHHRIMIDRIRQLSASWNGKRVSYLSTVEEKWEILLAIVHGPCLMEPQIEIELLFEPEDGTSKQHIHPSPRGLMQGIVTSTDFDSIFVRTEDGEVLVPLDELIRGLTPRSDI